jgi:Fe-Mn family superoxide dismutase
MIPLEPLPYPYDALKPTISERALRLHHDKHQATYVRNTNSLAATAGLADESLADIVLKAWELRARGLYNNAAQAWNHDFFWRSMRPGGAKPPSALTRLISREFGSQAGFKEAFVKAGANHFGSGWLWLVLRGRTLRLGTTHDARNFLTRRAITPLLVCDLWEHAYYLDFQNERGAYLGAWFDQVADWTFADRNLGAMRTVEAERRVEPGRPAAV